MSTPTPEELAATMVEVAASAPPGWQLLRAYLCEDASCSEIHYLFVQVDDVARLPRAQRRAASGARGGQHRRRR